MRRETHPPRPEWQAKVAKTGLLCNVLSDGSPYWYESAHWEFSSAEIDRLEAATAEIQRLASAAADYILKHDRLAEMKISPSAAAYIRESWESQPPAVYGRLDLAYDGRQIKLLEYNADTPTALVEAAVTQWYWLQDCFPNADQFNSIHEKLVSRWKDLLPRLQQPLYFGHDGSDEDFMTITYLRDTAEQAGHRTIAINIRSIAWEEAERRFVDPDGEPIQSIFKLYPWEWMLADPYGPYALETIGPVQRPMQWIEPIWRIMWSNKALLAVLWELNQGHELLLPAYLDGPRSHKDYVAKPLFGREGAGVKVFRNGNLAEEGTEHSQEHQAEDLVYQQLAAMAMQDGNTAVIGSWLVDGKPAGIGIRESSGLITTNSSRFVPHLVR